MLRINYIIFSVVFLLAKNTIHPLGMIINGNEPVPFATIKNIKTNNWSISNDQGIFNVPSNTQYGDTLIINRIGFEKKKIIASSNIIIELNPELVKLSEIRVEAKKNKILALPKSLASRQTIAMQLSGTTLRTYGGDAGIAQLSTDGGRSKDTKIIFDGVDLTSPQNGVTDLSQLPRQYFGFISKDDNQYLRQGSGTSDGIIYFTPWNYPKTIDYTIEQDGSRSVSGHYQISKPIFNLNLAIGKHSFTGKHPVWYNNQLIERKNQEFDQSFSGLKLNIQKGKWFGKSSFWYSSNKRGINETIWSPNTEAYRVDTLLIFNTSLTRLFSKGSVEFSFSHRHSGENYVDPTRAINSIHLSNTATYNLKSQLIMNKLLSFNIKSSIINESIRSSEAGAHNRNIYVFAPSVFINGFIGFNLISSLRLDYYSDFGQTVTFSSKFVRIISKSMRLTGTSGTSFKAPTFNDLYWIPGGNPDLKPEKSSFQKVEIFGSKNKINYNLELRKTYSKNLIEWISVNNFFQPKNIAKSRRSLIKFSSEVPINNFLRISCNLARLWSENLSTNEKLRYAPDWIGNSAIYLNFKSWEVGTSLHYISKQIHLYGYPNHTLINPNYISYFEIKTPPFINEQFQIKCYLSNALNNEIISIYGYPEASRKFKMNFSYKLK